MFLCARIHLFNSFAEAFDDLVDANGQRSYVVLKHHVTADVDKMDACAWSCVVSTVFITIFVTVDKLCLLQTGQCVCDSRIK